jgi:hypothetical protein
LMDNKAFHHLSKNESPKLEYQYFFYICWSNLATIPILDFQISDSFHLFNSLST